MTTKRPKSVDSGLISLRAIKRFARQIAERFQPEKIILFGSYAYGEPNADSDVDLLVVMPAKNQLDQAFKIRLALDAPFPMDLIVRTPKKLAERLEDGELFTTHIVGNGMVLFENGMDEKLYEGPRSSVSHWKMANGSQRRLLRKEGSFMKRATMERVKKAEVDRIAAKQSVRSDASLHDIVCFHCQQCAEKYLKALLEELNMYITKTHDLLKLNGYLVNDHPSLRSLTRGLKFLTQFAVETRYPEEDASRRQAQAAIRWMERVRKESRRLLGI